MVVGDSPCESRTSPGVKVIADRQWLFLFIFLIFNVKVILLDTRCLGKVQSYFTWISRVGCGTNNNEGKAASIWIQLF